MADRKRKKAEYNNEETKHGVNWKRPKLEDVPANNVRYQPTYQVSRGARAGSIDIFTQLKISDWRAVAQKKIVFSCFKPDYRSEINRFSKQLVRQMMFFKVEKNLRGLSANCCLCNHQMPIYGAKEHCCSSRHLFNMMNRFVDEENRKYLINATPIYCSLCDVDLFDMPYLDFKHFDSESHNQKLREIFNGGRNENTGLKPDLESTSSETEEDSDVQSFVESTSGNSTPNYADCVFEKNSSVLPLIPLKNLKLQSLPNYKKFQTLAAKIGLQVNFFVVNSFTLRVICTLCKVYLNVNDVWEHVESRRHFLNMVLPLIKDDSRAHLDYVNGKFGCCLCNTLLSRGQCLLEHFESSDHRSMQLSQNQKSEKAASYKDRMTAVSLQPNYTSLPPDFKNFKSVHEMTELRNPHLLSRFLHLASKIEREINVFVFEFELFKKLRIFCTTCKISFPNLGLAIEHVEQKMHSWNAERYKKETEVDPWVPSTCDNNWRFLWPVAGKLEVFCTICCAVLPNKIPAWFQHFHSTQHCVNIKKLHDDLMTAELSYSENKIKKED